jgi:hypothetical protein
VKVKGKRLDGESSDKLGIKIKPLLRPQQVDNITSQAAMT